MASLDQQLDVRLHESDFHSDVFTVGKHGVSVLSSPLDEAEDVVPATAVQPARMGPQLPQDLVHLERRGQRLDQDGRADAAGGDTAVRLAEVEDVGPQASFEVVLHLGEVEVRAAAVIEEVLGVVEEEEGEIEDGTGHGLVVDEHARFVEVPSAGAKDTPLVSTPVYSVITTKRTGRSK